MRSRFLVEFRGVVGDASGMRESTEESRAIRALHEFRREVARTPAAKLDCLELERRALDVLKEVGCELMREVLERADTEDPEITIDGARWGNRRRSKCTYTTVFGDVEMERSTYQQAGRGRVAVPLELRLGMVEGRYTPQMARVMTRAAGLMTAPEASEFLAEVGIAQVSVSTLHRAPRAIAARYETMREQIERDLRASDVVPDEARTVQVSLDGVMVPQDSENARPRGRKTEDPDPPRHEQRYGVVGTEGPATSDGLEGRAWHEASVGTLAFYGASGKHLRTIYRAQMPQGGKAQLVVDLEAELRAVIEERPELSICFASDGAPQHWTILESMQERIPRTFHGIVTYLLDFFHAAEYVQLAANAACGAETPEADVLATNWRETLKLFGDGATRVLKSMRYQRDRMTASARDEIEEAISYLANQARHDRMRYAEALLLHYPIGTGVTEAAAKTIVGVRMKRAGARFSQHGGQTVMLFRAAILSDRFDALSEILEHTYTASLKAA